ncbi:MAG: oxidoreductase coenzyme F420-dependent [Firmicutes bacterium]|nr:oxidoreductase coenzyme F420-dependent [Bacillota bacterium]
MRIGLIGTGRMGKELIRRLATKVNMVVYDRNPAILKAVTREWRVTEVESLEAMMDCSAVILAVPDKEVVGCIKAFNRLDTEMVLINIATNITQKELEQVASESVRCISVKIVGNAGEMALGGDPVVIVNERPQDLVVMAKKLFAPVGQVVQGNADVVQMINTVAAEKALAAAVDIEETLIGQGIRDDEIIRGAIRQVAAGVIRAYADQELGPFAREIVRGVWAKMKIDNSGD